MLGLSSPSEEELIEWLTGLSVAVLFVILFFGLRPKGFSFSNNVRWIHDQPGIRFSKNSLAYTDPIEEFRKKDGFGANGLSVEIALKPLSAEEGFNLILTLHNGEDEDQLIVGQWRSWIIAMNGDNYDNKRRVKRVSVNNTSRSPAVQFLTLTTGKKGTKAYIDGQLILDEKDLTLFIPYGEKARLTIGNSVYGRQSWHGEICIHRKTHKKRSNSRGMGFAPMKQVQQRFRWTGISPQYDSSYLPPKEFAPLSQVNSTMLFPPGGGEGLLSITR